MANNTNDEKTFKIGDTVRCIAVYYGNHKIKNQTGTICNIDSDGTYGVNFHKDINGHSCNGSCPDECGWYIPSQFLKAVKKEEKLVIVAHGNKVTAKLIQNKRTIAQGMAACSPDDTFNFLTGAQIALARLAKSRGVKPILCKNALEGIEII